MSLASFVVLIDGSPTIFFDASIYLNQGCPMSPFLFLLVAKGLNRLIIEVKREWTIKDIRVIGSIGISHLPFIDDILLFGQGSLKEMKHYKILVDAYYGATSIEVNYNKSCMLLNGLGVELERQISQIFSLSSSLLDRGLEYTRFLLKPSDN